MRLNINFEPHPTRKISRAVIRDDRGEKLPCVRAVNVDYKYGDAAIVTVVLVVNGKDVYLGDELPAIPATRYFDCIGAI